MEEAEEVKCDWIYPLQCNEIAISTFHLKDKGRLYFCKNHMKYVQMIVTNELTNEYLKEELLEHTNIFERLYERFKSLKFSEEKLTEKDDEKYKKFIIRRMLNDIEEESK